LKVNRLLFIAIHCPPLAQEALSLALGLVKETPNHRKYQHVLQRLNMVRESQGLPPVPEDRLWVEDAARNAKLKGERLEADLKGYKENQIKETIRVCFSLVFRGSSLSSS
jgi:COP9 signalosome complex subunit 1